MEDSPRFYCGLSHTYWSHHLCNPGPYACISPIAGAGKHTYGINSLFVPDGTGVLQDSGAYAETFGTRRLSFEDALQRQERHAEMYHYADKIVYRASYDLLVDHRFSRVPGSSRRKIQRIPESSGRVAVERTVQAAQFLNQHRNGYNLALNVQGATPGQYLQCVEQVVPLLRDSDILGLGGWCVLGRLPSMMGDFLQVLAAIMPVLAREKVQRVHLYGCIYTPAIAALLAMCDAYALSMSLDSAFPSFAPRLGKWGYGSWRDTQYQRPKVLPSCATESCKSGTRCAGLECIRHVRCTRHWLTNFRWREKALYQKYARNLDQYQYGQILDMTL
jgi:hypothetical protein